MEGRTVRLGGASAGLPAGRLPHSIETWRRLIWRSAVEKVKGAGPSQRTLGESLWDEFLWNSRDGPGLPAGRRYENRGAKRGRGKPVVWLPSRVNNTWRDRVILLGVVVTAVDFVADDGDVAFRCVEWIGLPREADGRDIDLRFHLARCTKACETEMLGGVFVLRGLAGGFPNHLEAHSRGCRNSV
jgi:hypothetical protein